MGLKLKFTATQDFDISLILGLIELKETAGPGW